MSNGDNMKKILSILLGALLLSGCSEKALHKYSMTATDIGFDTVVSFNAYTENEAAFNSYSAELKKQFRYYDRLFDKYNSYDGVNNIKTINDNAGKQPVKVEPVIIDLLKLAKAYDTISDHQFDITMGSVLNIWHDYREAGTLANQKNKESSIPSMKELQTAAKHSGWKHVQIDEKNSTVYIDDRDVSLDVGGVAKGYAVELIADQLQKDGLQHAIINGGGNIRLIGDKPDNEAWSVGIQIPNLKAQSTDSLISVKSKGDTSFVTSGDYQRYYTYKGKIMHHIIDPDTLMPARHSRSVTVITDNSGIADILSTTLYTMSHEEGVKLINRLQKEENIQVNAIWVYDDIQKPENGTDAISVKGYQIVFSDGLKDKIKES